MCGGAGACLTWVMGSAGGGGPEAAAEHVAAAMAVAQSMLLVGTG